LAEDGALVFWVRRGGVCGSAAFTRAGRIERVQRAGQCSLPVIPAADVIGELRIYILRLPATVRKLKATERYARLLDRTEPQVGFQHAVWRDPCIDLGIDPSGDRSRDRSRD